MGEGTDVVFVFFFFPQPFVLRVWSGLVWSGLEWYVYMSIHIYVYICLSMGLKEHCYVPLPMLWTTVLPQKTRMLLNTFLPSLAPTTASHETSSC